MSRDRTAGIARWSRIAFWCAIAVLFGIAAGQRFSLDSLPFCDGDHWGYLRPALMKVQGGEFVHTFARSFVYPGFVFVILKAFGSLQALTVIQHVMGLASGLMLMLAWLGLRPLLPQRAWVFVVHGMLALPLVGASLLPETVVLAEHSLRPEGVFPFVLALLLFLGVRLAAVAHGSQGVAKLRIVLGSGALLCVTGLLYNLKPQFALAVPVSIAFVAWIAMRARLGLLRTLGVFVVSGVLVWVTLVRPEQVLAREDPLAAQFLPRVLLFWHKDLSADVLREDALDPAYSDEERAFRKQLVETCDEEQKAYEAADARNYASLGFNPDALFYGAAGQCLDRYFVGPRKDACPAFCRDVFVRAVQRHPLDYLRKVVRQLEIVYAFPGRLFDSQRSLTAGQLYRQSGEVLASYSKSAEFGEIAQGYLHGVRQLEDSPAPLGCGVEPIESALVKLLRWLSEHHVAFLLGAAAAGGFVVARHIQLRRRGSRGLPCTLDHGAVVLAINAWSFGLMLTPAAIHSLEVGRYLYLQHALAFLVIVANAMFTLVAARALVLGDDGTADRDAKRPAEDRKLRRARSTPSEPITT